MHVQVSGSEREVVESSSNSGRVRILAEFVTQPFAQIPWDDFLPSSFSHGLIAIQNSPIRSCINMECRYCAYQIKIRYISATMDDPTRE